MTTAASATSVAAGREEMLQRAARVHALQAERAELLRTHLGGPAYGLADSVLAGQLMVLFGQATGRCGYHHYDICGDRLCPRRATRPSGLCGQHDNAWSGWTAKLRRWVAEEGTP
jgi:hypothetical protein